MASTLTVDNIVGATSSNEIHIPGHVIGYAQDTWSNTIGTQSYNTNGFVDVVGTDITYTPKRSNSVIIVQWNIQGRALAPSGQDLRYGFRSLLDGGSSQEYDIVGDNLGKLGDSVWVPQWINITRKFNSTGALMTFKCQASRGSANGNYFQLPHHGDNLNHISKTVWEIAQ